MAYTGYLVVQYIDENPNSSGYGETWTERVLNLGACPNGSGGSWVLIASECEMDTSGHTGLRINTYYNDVTGEYSSTTVADADCASSAETFDDEEHWVNSGDPYCEIDDNGLYTGMGIQLQVQTNFNFLSYGSTREVRIEMSECSGYTQPQWEEISHQCHVVTDELTCYLTFDGTADILQIDTNPSSPTFNHTRTISGESEECYCEACDRIDYSWRLIDDVCGIQMPSNYGLTGLTDDTVYHVYRKYGTCIIDGQSGATKPMNEYSAVTYQTGVTDCIYRWVDTEETVCVEEFNGKFLAEYIDGSKLDVDCNSSTTLTTGETKPSGYEASAMTSAVIGDCVTIIGYKALSGCSSLTSCTIGSGVTSIGDYVFEGCSSLTSINIPSGVTSIGGYAFANCSSLTSITVNATTPPTLRSTVFRYTNDCPIYVPAESVDAYKAASGWSTYASRITAIPNS